MKSAQVIVCWMINMMEFKHIYAVINFQTILSIQCFLLLLLLSLSPSSILATNRIPRLSPIRREGHPERVISDSTANDFKTYYYDQTLDHFNYNPLSYSKFKQRYVVNDKFWGGANISAPIFAYLGAEAPLDGDIGAIGFLTDNAPFFKPLLVYIEHRFYGESVPFGTMDEAMKNNITRGYFSSAQALADYAEVLLHVKQKYNAHLSPIIVVGGSYGGMLASWFRLKYPHIAVGALASSAPILYFDNITPQNGYYHIVTKDFKEASENCYESIRESWSEIDKVAAKPNGLSILTKIFKTCSPLNNSSELKDYLETIYANSAQYNSPPIYPVTQICGGIDQKVSGGTTSLLGRIFSGIVANKGNQTCYDIQEYNQPSETEIGWRWQTCSEMVIPIGRLANDTMFQAAPFILDGFIKSCNDTYGVPPRPHWITTYYGGHDIKLVLKRFGSNIIFSNGLRDPYSSGGVLENLSKSLLAVHTVKGSHCLDILPAEKGDPLWLVKQRKVEVKIISGWLKQYYADLVA